MIRHSLNSVPWNDRKAVAADVKTIYRAENAGLRLAEFEKIIKNRGHFPSDDAAAKILYGAVPVNR